MCVFSCLFVNCHTHTVPMSGMPGLPVHCEYWLRSGQDWGVSSLKRLPWNLSRSDEFLFFAFWALTLIIYVCDYLLAYFLLCIRSSLRLGKMSYQFFKLQFLGRKYNIWLTAYVLELDRPVLCLLTNCATLETLLNLYTGVINVLTYWDWSNVCNA